MLDVGIHIVLLLSCCEPEQGACFRGQRVKRVVHVDKTGIASDGRDFERIQKLQKWGIQTNAAMSDGAEF